MTAQNLYNKFLKKEISKEKFLYEVRKQSHLPITKFNSFQDTIQILKTRGLISEEIGKYKTDKNVFFPKQDIKTIDQVSPHEYAKGINYEMDLFDKSVGQNMPKDEELAKVQEKVLKNLTSDEYYYTRKMMSDEQKKVEKSDLDVEELGKDTKAKNQMIKGKMLKENLDDLGDGYTHFAIMKSNNKIADGWDYSELYDEETRSYDNASIKEYTKLDLTDNFPENKPSDFKILTRKSVEKMGLNPKDTNNWYKPGMNENLDQHYSQDDEDLSMDLSQSEECKSCNRDKPELDIDVMDPNELERLSKIIEEWGLTEYDLEDSDVIEELADEFQKRWGLEEAIAVKDKAGNIQYAKDDSEATDIVNQAKQKGVQLTKQNV